MANSQQAHHGTDDHRGLDRDHSGEATKAIRSDLENEVDRESHRVQRRYDSPSPQKHD